VCSSEYNIQDLKNQIEQNELAFDSWKSNQKLSTAENLKQLESSRKTIEGHISELERLIKNSTIYAPIEGKISEIRKLNIGDYVLAGEEVLKIVPQNEVSLKAELYVDSSYVARVQVGNPVKIKFPGLAPSRYGMIETEVSLIPPDVTITENGQAVFIVEAVIQNPYLKEKHGSIAKLLPGITAEGRIVTDRSTAMQMILRKLDFIN
jgi:multidrug resistance efflux pump